MEKGQKTDGQDVSKETREAAQAIAHDPQVLAHRIDLINQMGVSGERRSIALVCSVIDSRLNKAYDNGDQGTLALKLSAAPGTGKTNVVSVSLRIQNGKDFLRISSGSEKSLYHFKAGLSYRALILEEAHAVQRRDTTFAYVLRQLLTEGIATYLVTEKKAKGDFESSLKKIVGPISLVTTTVLPDLEAQLESRILTVRLDESTAQTQRIIAKIATTASGAMSAIDLGALDPWKEFHGALEPARVVIPFAPQIIGPLMSFSPLPTESRRAFKRVLGLIMAVAIAYQTQRSKDGAGRLIAEMADYHMARQMLEEIFEDGLAEQNGLYQQRIDFIRQSKTPIQMQDLVREWRVSKKAVSQLLTRARDEGFVIWCDKTGKPFANPADERTAKHSGRAFVKATTPPPKAASIRNLLPSPYELTRSADWDEGGREWERYNLWLA